MASSTWLTHEEIQALDCAMAADLTPTRETVARMLATIKHLQRELVTQAQRRHAALESDRALIAELRARLCDVQPGQIGAIVESRVPEPAVGRRGR